MFQICFWANPSQDLVFEMTKIIHPFDYKLISGLVLPCIVPVEKTFVQP
jgi:hypothetical protein